MARAEKQTEKNRNPITLEDGESIVLRLIEAKTIAKDLFDETREIVRCVFEFPDKSKKTFENNSPGLASKLATLLGKMVVLRRIGIGEQTKYFAEEVKPPSVTSLRKDMK